MKLPRAWRKVRTSMVAMAILAAIAFATDVRRPSIECQSNTGENHTMNNPV